MSSSWKALALDSANLTQTQSGEKTFDIFVSLSLLAEGTAASLQFKRLKLDVMFVRDFFPP